MERALAAVRSGTNPFKASKEFGVPRSTLRKILAHKTTIDGKRGPLPTLGNQTEEMLCNWIEGLAKRGFPISKEDLICSVEKLVSDLKINTPFTSDRPGKKWVTLFMKRHPNIAPRTAEKLAKNRSALTKEALERWFIDVENELKAEKKFDVLQFPERIFNIDESGFQLCPKGEKVLALRGQKNVYEHSGNEKENVTVLLGFSATGVLVPPLVVYPGQRLPKGLSSHMPINDKWSFARSDKGWITGETFFEYIANVFYPWLVENKITLPVILFLDGHSSHLTLHLSQLCSKVGIILIALHPNATHVIQPLDVAVFGPLKKKWARAVHKWKLEHNEVSISKLHLPKLLDEILASELSQETLINGFRACGLFPFTPLSVDYSKCGPEQQSLASQDSVVVDEKHLYVESLIGKDLVLKFAKKDAGAIKDHDVLFNLWSKSLSLQKGAKYVPPPIEDAGISNVNEFTNRSVEATSPSTEPTTVKSVSLEEIISPTTGGANVPSPFKRNLFWPASPKKKSAVRRRLRLPSVVTSPNWRKFEGDRIARKKELERLKEERKLEREKKKQEKEKELNLKEKRRESESSESSIEVPELSEDDGANWDELSAQDSTESSPVKKDVGHLKIGDYVIVLYAQSHFPGLITDTTEDGFKVSAMEKSLNNWKWPFPSDIMAYSKADIIQIIQSPKCINKRGVYEVKEMKKFSNYFV